MWLYNISKIFEHPFREDIWIKINFFLSLVINIILWLVMYFRLQPYSYLSNSGHIFLHLNIYFGIDRIGPWYHAFVIPLLGLFIIVLNILMAYYFYLQEKTLSYFLVFTMTGVQLILFASGIFVILLNI